MGAQETIIRGAALSLTEQHLAQRGYVVLAVNYRGGSGFGGIRDLPSKTIAVCHFNDAPASPPQFEQTDADRVYPGDGILPLNAFLRDLDAIGYEGFLSLELFNPGYWTRDLSEVAGTGREKTEAVVRSAGEPGLDSTTAPS